MIPTKPKAADWKKKAVDEFVKLLKEYPIVGTVNVESFPAKQLQSMRDQLRGKAEIKMAKKNLLKIAIEKVKGDKKGIEELIENLKGMPALIFTKDNPFTLFKFIEKNKSSMPAKAGQVAPKDVIVPAGPTGFSPGPIIGELGSYKIKAGIEDGKVAIKEDSLAAKEGDVIDANLAGILSRLGIEPMEMGLDITAMYEDGFILKKDVLAVDEEQYIANIKMLSQEAFNLAVFAAFPTQDTTELLITNAARDALAVATEQAIVTKETASKLLGKAEAQAMGLKGKVE